MVFIFHYGSLKVKVEVVPGYDHYCHLLTISDYQIREIHSWNPASRRDFIPDPKFNLFPSQCGYWSFSFLILNSIFLQLHGEELQWEDWNPLNTGTISGTKFDTTSLRAFRAWLLVGGPSGLLDLRHSGHKTDAKVTSFSTSMSMMHVSMMCLLGVGLCLGFITGQ